MFSVLTEVRNEMQKQTRKGYDAAHDDEHVHYELPRVAAMLVSTRVDRLSGPAWGRTLRAEKTEREQLIIAAALTIREIERLDRLEGRERKLSEDEEIPAEEIAEYISRIIPTGFSTPEDQQRAQGVVDAIAKDILEQDSTPGTEGLRGVLQRMNDHMLDLWFRVTKAEDENNKIKWDALQKSSEELLAKFE